jgi:hypothetical protein
MLWGQTCGMMSKAALQHACHDNTLLPSNDWSLVGLTIMDYNRI